MMIEPVVLNFTLRVITPVLVLSGRELSFFEHFFDREKRRILKVDFGLLIERLKSRGELKRFISFLRNFRPEDISSLHAYYKENSPFFYENGSPVAVAVDGSLSGRSVKEIVKNPLTGKPYIPGSSVKGAVRTAILEAVIDPEGFTWQIEKVKRESGRSGAGFRLSKIFGEMERELLCRAGEDYGELFEKPWTKRDPFRFIKVSDFLPSGEVEWRVGLLERVSRNGIFRKNNSVSLEYVARGTFKGKVFLYPDYLRGFLNCKVEVSGEKILRELEKRGKALVEKEKKLFSSIYASVHFPEDGIPLKLGFGGGALSKTFLNDGLRVVGNRKTGFRVIPLTLPVINS